MCGTEVMGLDEMEAVVLPNDAPRNQYELAIVRARAKLMSLNDDDREAMRQILREELEKRNPELVNIAKETVREWVQHKFQQFGRWSAMGLLAGGVYLLIELVLWFYDKE